MQVVEMKLIPSSGGCFELTANGKLLYSKLAEGRFPDEELMLKQMEVIMSEAK
jgi:selenoprotein W-related protein